MRCMYTVSPDTTPPVIDLSSATLFSTGSWLKAGAEVSLTIAITGNSVSPEVTVPNGAGTVVTTSTSSLYTFKYTVQSADNGRIFYIVTAVDAAGNKAQTTIDSARFAGE